MEVLTNHCDVMCCLQRYQELVLAKLRVMMLPRSDVTIDEWVEMFKRHCDECGRSRTLEEFSFHNSSQTIVVNDVISCRHQREVMSLDEKYRMYALLFAEAICQHALSQDDPLDVIWSRGVVASVRLASYVSGFGDVFDVFKQYFTDLSSLRADKIHRKSTWDVYQSQLRRFKSYYHKQCIRNNSGSVLPAFSSEILRLRLKLLTAVQ